MRRMTTTAMPSQAMNRLPVHLAVGAVRAVRWVVLEVVRPVPTAARAVPAAARAVPELVRAAGPAPDGIETTSRRPIAGRTRTFGRGARLLEPEDLRCTRPSPPK